MKNYYPEKPMLPFQRTSVAMADVIKALQSIQAGKEVKRMAYIIFRNESANGQAGINNNYCGIQADAGRWDPIFDDKIVGVVEKVENGTGYNRLFCAFNNVSDCLSMLVSKVASRGLDIGGTVSHIWHEHIDDKMELARAYYKEWVTGDAKAEPTALMLSNFFKMYAQSENFFI